VTFATPAPPRAPPAEARCRACGGWLGTVPAGTRWLRTRCLDRRCALHGVAQTVHLVKRE